MPDQPQLPYRRTPDAPSGFRPIQTRSPNLGNYTVVPVRAARPGFKATPQVNAPDTSFAASLNAFTNAFNTNGVRFIGHWFDAMERMETEADQKAYQSVVDNWSVEDSVRFGDAYVSENNRRSRNGETSVSENPVFQDVQLKAHGEKHAVDFISGLGDPLNEETQGLADPLSTLDPKAVFDQQADQYISNSPLLANDESARNGFLSATRKAELNFIAEWTKKRNDQSIVNVDDSARNLGYDALIEVNDLLDNIGDSGGR